MKLLTDIKKSRATFDTSETKKEFGPGKKVLSVFSLVESETLKILFKSLAWKIVFNDYFCSCLWRVSSQNAQVFFR